MDPSTLNKLHEYKINAFIEGIRRARWLLLWTVLCASILLIQTYVTHFSYADSQLAGITADEVTHARLRYLNSWQSGLAGVEPLEPAGARKSTHEEREFMRQLQAFGTALLAYKRDRKTVEELKYQDRDLPQLPVKVLDGDFLPVMGVILAVLCTCLWLSIAAVAAAVPWCKEHSETDRELKEVARLNLLFPVGPGPVRGDGRRRLPGQHHLAKWTQHVAIWMPSFVFLLAVGLDAGSTWRSTHPSYSLAYVPPPAQIVLRAVILGVTLVILVCTARATAVKSRDMDAKLAS
jgi:hypothetical protein